MLVGFTVNPPPEMALAEFGLGLAHQLIRHEEEASPRLLVLQQAQQLLVLLSQIVGNCRELQGDR